MLHVFNGPVEPVSLAEFQKAKGKKALFTCQNKRKITYHEDGRKFIDDKIENEQSASNLWSTALKRSVAQDLKDRPNEEFTLRNLGLVRYVSYLLQQFVSHRNIRTTFVLIALNVVLISVFLYIFVF
uniref:Vesicle-associated membrane protein 726 n=1 Tax=Elaeophora elaphi TaxID=1147741 RepID=A0A0R3RFG5_9BILA